MRVSTAWIQQLNVDAMSRQQSKLTQIQQQLNTGLRLTEPADDPAAAARVLDLQGNIDQITQYQSNISIARGRLDYEETALETSGNILDRAKELAMQAMNASQTDANRLTMKFEVDQLIEQLAVAANSQNANGEFIFSGGVSNKPAFAINPNTGEYVYQGSPQLRTLAISPTRQVADGDVGFNVFENINSASSAADENGKRSIFSTLKTLSDSLAKNFTATSARITGDRFLSFGLDYTNTVTQFNLVTNSNGSVAAPIDLSGKKFATVNDLAAEINNQLTAGGFNASIQARVRGSSIEFAALDSGSSSTIEIDNVTGTFLSDAGFVNGQTYHGSDLAPANQVFLSQMSDVLKDLSLARDNILQIRSSVGVRLNVLDEQQSQNEKFILDAKSTLSDTQDLDYADAISRYQLQSTALQAAQQSFAKIKGLSLFNYLQ